MANNIAIPHFEPFDVHGEPTTLSLRWTRWSTRFENLMTALNVTDVARKKALLLHLAGDALYDVYDGLVVPTIPDDADAAVTNEYTVAKKALDDHFSPAKNAEFEIYNFRLAKQQVGEPIDAYHSRLRSLAKYCLFADVDAEIKSHIIQTCLSTRLRRRALSEPTLTFTQLMDIARAMETAERQVRVIEGGTTEPRSSAVAAVRSRNNNRRPQPQQHRVAETNNTDRRCRNCGGVFPHPGGRTSCPAWGKQCRLCLKPNHFARQCRSATDQQRNFRSTPRQPPPQPPPQTAPRNAAPRHRQVRHVQQDIDLHDESRDVDADAIPADDEYAFAADKPSTPKQPTVSVKLQGTTVNCIVDTGASVNILDESAFQKLEYKPVLHKSRTRIYAYGCKKPMKVLGTFHSEVETKDKIADALFFVIEGQGNASLLSYKTASMLGLIKVDVAAGNVNIVRSQDPLTLEKLAAEHPELFENVGKLKNHEVKLHIDQSVKPVAQPHRRIPFHLRKKVEDELQSLLDQDIIEPAKGATPWVSPIVTPPKPNEPDKVRLCVDMRQGNQAIIRERHVMPTLDDVINDLNGSVAFSKIDLQKSYHQLVLSESSRYITTFSTHVGLFRYKRLNFGISSASEIFQHTLSQVLQGIPGVKNISDDIIVHGASQEAHDASLREVIKRLLEHGLTLNKAKCQLNQKRLKFFGHIFTANGVSVDPKRIETIMAMEPPKNAAEVRSFLSMVNFNSRFIENYASLSEPLRRLTRADAAWEWGEQQAAAFTQLKQNLCKNVETAYFDPNLRSVVHVDAGPTAIAGILSQRDDSGRQRVVMCISRGLTDVERRYSQTEREALSCVWAVERLHQFLYGSEFDLVTDHRSLQFIYGNPRAKMPARVERWGLRLSPYQYRVVFKPGKNNPADYLSRHTSTETPTEYDRTAQIAEEYINSVIHHAVPKSMTIDEIRAASLDDPTMQQLQSIIDAGRWDDRADDAVSQYKHVFNELSSADGIILRQSRLVIPAALQRRVVELAHEGHQGIVKTKALLRTKVYFPGMDRLTENLVKQCIACQANTLQNNYEPLQTTELPPGPWQNLSIDFCGPFPNGEYLLCLMDDFSRFCFAEVLHSTSARAVIPVLDRIFSTMGNITQLKSDNGPPFQSQEFANFVQYYGFHHRRITPVWPRANGEIERFVKTLSKSLRAAVVEGRCFKQHLHSFLRAYRSTPQSTTGKSPAELLFGTPRSFLTRIPEKYSQNETSPAHDDARKTDKINKSKMKKYYDERHSAKPSQLKIGDTVIVQKPRVNKLSSFYDPRPYVITGINGSMITATRENHTITRNSSHFKKVDNRDQPTSQTKDKMEEEDFDELDLPSTPLRPQQPPAAPPERRYPRRNRRPPQNLRDFVPR